MAAGVRGARIDQALEVVHQGQVGSALGDVEGQGLVERLGQPVHLDSGHKAPTGSARATLLTVTVPAHKGKWALPPVSNPLLRRHESCSLMRREKESKSPARG